MSLLGWVPTGLPNLCRLLVQEFLQTRCPSYDSMNSVKIVSGSYVIDLENFVGLRVHLYSSYPALCRLWGCKNRPALFPGRMSYKATKPGPVCPPS